MNKKMIKSVVILFISLYISRPLAAQNIMEGSKGTSSLDYSQYGGGLISFNGAEKKIELSYINYKFKRRPLKKGSWLNYSETPYWYGLTVSGQAVNGYSTIFSKGKVYPSTNINLKAGYRIFGDPHDYLNNSGAADQFAILAMQGQLATTQVQKDSILKAQEQLTNSLKPPSELWFIARAGYNVSKFYLFDDTRRFEEQFQSTRFDGLTGSIGLNYWNPKLFNSKLILLAGLTVGLRKQDNIAELEEISVDDETVITNPQTNTRRSFKSTQVGFAGPYQTFTSIPINFDFYFKPHNLTNAAFSFYGRINSFNKINGVAHVDGRQYPTNLGVGVFLLNENWLANPAGGVTFELRDTFKTLSSTASFKDRLVINFVTRVNILRYRE